MFIIALIASAIAFLTDYFLYDHAAVLTARLRSLSFESILRQDGMIHLKYV